MDRRRPDLARLVARWQGAPHTLAHVRDGANAVYEFQADGTRLVLRLTEDHHRTRNQLEAELDFVRFVASRGVLVACPLPSTEGAWVETVPDDDGDAWHAVVFTAAPGRHFRFFSADIDRPLLRAWGRAMGALHAASREFVPVATRRRPHWAEQDTTRCDGSTLPPAEIEALREHARVSEWLASLRATPESWGMIHGDFERTNFVMDGATLRVYDFDDACYHWYLADIAHGLWAFRDAPPPDRSRFLTWFLEGYREQSALEMDAREHFSWFVRVRSLSLFLNRLQAAPAIIQSAADGVWERRMRAAFEAQVRW
ncbi:MAG: phosphotransferase enzyme family protein [Gemmatimonadaceae bacterium]